jgi:beta-glucosidase
MNTVPFLTGILVCINLTNPAYSQSKNPVKQPVLGTRSAKLIESDGLKFRDLNKNNQLDKYEDWRLPADERSRDLLAKMSVEQKVGFMLISTTRLKNDWSFEAPKSKEPLTSDFNEDDLVATQNMFTKKPLPTPLMNAAGTTKAVSQFHGRHFILRANVSARMTAEWANKLQALCESQPLGIPAIVASNPHYGRHWHECWQNSVLVVARRIGFVGHARPETDPRICRHCPAGVGRCGPSQRVYVYGRFSH